MSYIRTVYKLFSFQVSSSICVPIFINGKVLIYHMQP